MIGDAIKLRKLHTPRLRTLPHAISCVPSHALQWVVLVGSVCSLTTLSLSPACVWASTTTTKNMTQSHTPMFRHPRCRCTIFTRYVQASQPCCLLEVPGGGDGIPLHACISWDHFHQMTKRNPRVDKAGDWLTVCNDIMPIRHDEESVKKYGVRLCTSIIRRLSARGWHVCYMLFGAA